MIWKYESSILSANAHEEVMRATLISTITANFSLSNQSPITILALSTIIKE